MKLIANILITTVAVLIAAKILPGVEVDSFTTALIVALVLGFLTTVVKPIISLVALPITILTLGLFSFVINLLMILLTDYLIAGFSLASILIAILFGLVVSVVNAVLGVLK